jgi:cytochrome c oxidase subunit 3
MAHAKNHDYHILAPSSWPLLGALGGFAMLGGAVLWMHGITPYVFLGGLVATLYVMFAWWSEVVTESEVGDHTGVVRIDLRYGFILFIMSEVMFFVAFFWAFFDASIFPGGDIQYLRAEYTGGMWPPPQFEIIKPFDLPFLMTMILLLSGCTVTWAHHAILEGKNNDAIKGLGLSVLLGVIFLGFQVYEYAHAHLGFTDGIYPSTFFMATGFHGFHVFVGTVFLFVCWQRARKGHFTPKSHFGFEAAAWYWHFVDVVWLFLFIAIYWWGNTIGTGTP